MYAAAAPAAPISASLIGSGSLYRDVRSSIRNLLYFLAISAEFAPRYSLLAQTKMSKRYARKFFVTLAADETARGGGNKISRHSRLVGTLGHLPER
jgi:hypothetical protein